MMPKWVGYFRTRREVEQWYFVLKIFCFPCKKKIKWMTSFLVHGGKQCMEEKGLNHKLGSKSKLFLETRCFISGCFSCFLFGIYKENILFHPQVTCVKIMWRKQKVKKHITFKKEIPRKSRKFSKVIVQGSWRLTLNAI